MNIRQIAGIDCSYSRINREERQYAALLFAALCLPGNAQRFLRHLGFTSDHLGPDFGIFFEYAFLRDIWNKIDNDKTRREILRRLLAIQSIDRILELASSDINQKFKGLSRTFTSKSIHSPASWVVSRFADAFPENADFLNICRFKWCFNIKPDLVIHLDKDTAICIEAKHESCAGTYPASKSERQIFRDRQLKPIGQLELQKYLMEDLLGVETTFICLASRQTANSTHQSMQWAEAFSCLDLGSLPPFATKMITNVCK